MNKNVVAALYKKEITDILRDKKTILMMIVVPLILYPLIMMASLMMASSMASASTTNTYKVSLVDLENAERLREHFDITAEEYEYSFAYVYPESLTGDAQTALKNGEIDAYLTAETEAGKEHYQIYYLSSEMDSQTAAGMLEDMLMAYRENCREEIIEEAGLEADAVLYPVTMEYMDTATNEESVGSLFGYIVPFLLISSILMGAMYPAIDITAGEKERGTLETLLTLPVKKIELITSKFMATSTIAVGAALLNVISMGAMGIFFYQSMMATAEGEIEFSVTSYIPAILVTLLCACVFAMFSSAICLLVCIFAKSFKEAQNYTTPVMLVFMFAGMAGMIPSLELNSSLSLIPVVNFALLIADLFLFKFQWEVIAVVIMSNVAYSLLAVLIMAKVFCTEDVLFGDGTSGIRLIEKRSEMKEKQIPGIGDTALLMSVLLLMLFTAGSVFVIKWGLYGLILEQFLIFACTVFYSWYIKTDFKKVFRYGLPKFGCFPVAVLLWLGTYILMMLLTAGLTYIFPESAQNATEQTMALIENKPLILIVFAMAFMPALCEETAFRGFFFGTLSNKFKIATAILWTGAIFGLYHMSIVKFFAVGFLGGVIAYAVYKSGSIWVGVLMHFVNNLAAVCISLYPDFFEKALPFLFSESISMNTMIILTVTGVALFLVSIFLLKHTAGDFAKNKQEK